MPSSKLTLSNQPYKTGYDYIYTLKGMQGHRTHPFFKTENGKKWFMFEGVCSKEPLFLQEKYLYNRSLKRANAPITISKHKGRKPMPTPRPLWTLTEKSIPIPAKR